MKHITLLLLATTALVPLAAQSALANPLDGTVIAGAVTIEGGGTGAMTVNQSTDKAIIDWNTFDIGSGEITTFVQPSTSSVVLNRVTGGLGASEIIGSLTANGQVYLVNRDGILFGKDAVIDTGALVATTHDILNQDFLDGSYNFDIPGNPTASVVNLGVITVDDGGYAALVAPGVRNDGIITARLGKVSLASGNGFSLDLYGDSLIKLALSDEVSGEIIDVATGETLKSLVSNGGLLSADGGIVQLTAASTRAIVDSVINNTGNIEANSVGLKNGKIVLSAQTGDTKVPGIPAQKVKVSGTISAIGAEAGETGGTIEITGDQIELLVATIDAFGWNGGGTVLIGGDVGGGNPNRNVVPETDVALAGHIVANATTAVVDRGTVIDASATVDGDGGKVIVWSDGSTTFDGTIAARGGSTGGDGGFVETSGHQTLSFDGAVDTSAALGRNGTLLLDPLSVTIGTVGAHTITPTAIVAALATSNVKVTTGATGAEAGDITVAEAVTWSTANSLTLSAAQNVNVNAAISNSGGADIFLRADDQGTGIGTVAFAGAGSVSTTGDVGIFYNPASYAAPENAVFAPFVTAGNFKAYMLVNSIDNLQNLSTNLSGTYALGRDIDASATLGWNSGLGFTPLGSFTGLLDGLDQEVSGLTINNTGANNLGLFSSIGSAGVVRNLGLVDASITGGASKNSIGVLAGFNQGMIEDSYATGTVTVGNSTQKVGGLVGWLLNGTIARSHADVHITGGSGVIDVGGLVGLTGFGGGGTITDSYATGDIDTGDASIAIGGLIGDNNGGTITNSYATGDVTGIGSTSFVGGLAGINSGYFGNGHITASYATGDVKSGVASHFVGGLIGYNQWGATVVDSYARGSATGDVDVGGLVGVNDVGASIATSYSTGIPTGTTNVGGLLGINIGSTVSGSYWDTQTSGTATGLGGSSGGSFSATGQTTTQLKAGVPAGFSTSVWGSDIALNDGYPHLKWPAVVVPTFVTLIPTPVVVPPPPPKVVSLSDPTGAKQAAELGAGDRDSKESEDVVRKPTPGLLKLAQEVRAAYSDVEIELIAENAKYARLADAAYSQGLSSPPDGWTIVANVLAEPRYFGLSAVAFENPETNEIVISFRGTISDLDWKIDRGLAPGSFGPFTNSATNLAVARFMVSLDFAREIRVRFPGRDVTITGHSLGGGIAQFVGASMGVDVVAFDPAPISFLLEETGNGRLESYGHILNFRNPNDPLTKFANSYVIGPAPQDVRTAPSLSTINAQFASGGNALNHSMSYLAGAMSIVELTKPYTIGGP